jgi:hypothetical protein
MVNKRTIDEILVNLTPQLQETIESLRVLVKCTVPETTELVRQGKIVYRLKERDFVWISHFSDHVDLEFAMGASLASDLFRNRGIAESNHNVRHISVNDFSKIESELARLLKEASSVGFEHCKKG